MIDVVERAFAPPQIDQILDCRDKILVGQNTLGRIDIDPKLLIDFVTANASEIIFLGIEKESLEQSTSIRHSRGIARAETPVNIFQRFFLVMGRIFPERLYDRVVMRNIDHFHLVNLECHDLADCRQSERFESPR